MPYDGTPEIKTISSKKYIYFCKRELGKVKSTYIGTTDINRPTSNSGATIQQVHCNDDYIYVLYTQTSTKSSDVNHGAIRVYDWSGNLVSDIVITNSSTVCTNYQGLFHFNGQWYYSNSGWTSNVGLGIFRINLDYSRL